MKFMALRNCPERNNPERNNPERNNPKSNNPETRKNQKTLTEIPPSLLLS
jgi:hypothetical protein